jgi:hypothetical protein
MGRPEVIADPGQIAADPGSVGGREHDGRLERPKATGLEGGADERRAQRDGGLHGWCICERR